MLLGMIVHIAAYQYTKLARWGITDLFWLRGCAIAFAMYGISFFCIKFGTPNRILTSIMAGLAVNCLIKDCFGKPTEWNIYDLYGAAVTVALIIYEQAKTKTDDSDGHRSISANGR